MARLSNLDLNVESAPLSTSTAYSFTNSQDFAGSTSFSGVNVNSSSLSLLPQRMELGFLNQQFLSRMDFRGVSNWRVAQDSRLGDRIWLQAGSITHSQSTGSYTGCFKFASRLETFRYSVSSEGSFDYLVFCR